MKYETVEFNDGTFGVRRFTFFGFDEGFLSTSGSGIWFESKREIYEYCRFNTRELARQYLDEHLTMLKNSEALDVKIYSLRVK